MSSLRGEKGILPQNKLVSHHGAAACFVSFLHVFIQPGFTFFIGIHIYDDSCTILIDGVA